MMARTPKVVVYRASTLWRMIWTMTSPSASRTTPSSRSVSRHGGSVTYLVTITPSNGFTGAVILSVGGFPSRASAAFNPDPATTSSTLTVTVSNGTTINSYTLIITGVSGGLTHTTMVTLVIT